MVEKDNTPAIECKDLSFSWVENPQETDYVLRRLSFDVKQKEFVSIVGPSGCGKTTLLNLLSGLQRPTFGKILKDGVEIDGPHKDLGYVFQDYSLFPWLNVQKNVQFGLKLSAMNQSEIDETTERVLKRVGLWADRKKFPHELSGGMKQRTAIARAFANNSKYLLMDEPFGSLDYHVREEMTAFLREIFVESNKSILFVTHNYEEAVMLSDRVMLMPSNSSKPMIPVEIEILEGQRAVTNSKVIEYRKQIINYYIPLNPETILGRYEIVEKDMFALFDAVCLFLEDKGVTVSYTDLETVVETDVYKIDRAMKDEDAHHETCISDGMEIWVHNDLEDVGGIAGRLYDLLHVGCGHLWQWNATSASGLAFYGDAAWKIGSHFYLLAPEGQIKTVWEYEKEAGLIAMKNLKSILNSSSLPIDFQTQVVKLFCDYLTTDLKYITDYYRTGKVKDFFEGWQFGSKAIDDIDFQVALKPERRNNMCVALIGKR